MKGQAQAERLTEVRKADVVCLRRVRKRRGRTTFGPGSVVAKSMSAGHGKSQRDDYVPVDADHPVARLLDRPQQKDGTETLGDVLEYATLQACLTGVSPFWCVPSAKYLSGGTWRPVQLYALPTALTQPQPAASAEYPSGWYRLLPYYATPTGGAGFFSGRTVGAIGAPLDGREVKRRLYKHPLYRWDGYSPLTACAFLLDVAEAVDQARWSQMQNGINPSLFITMSGADKAQIDRFGEEFQQARGGARASRKAIVVSTPSDQGKIDVKTPTQGQQRLDYSDDWEQVQAAVDQVMARFGRVDALVNNAGVAVFKPALETSFQEWRHVLSTNLDGAFLCTQAFGAIMARQRRGAVRRGGENDQQAHRSAAPRRPGSRPARGGARRPPPPPRERSRGP